MSSNVTDKTPTTTGAALLDAFFSAARYQVEQDVEQLRYKIREQVESANFELVDVHEAAQQLRDLLQLQARMIEIEKNRLYVGTPYELTGFMEQLVFSDFKHAMVPQLKPMPKSAEQAEEAVPSAIKDALSTILTAAYPKVALTVESLDVLAEEVGVLYEETYGSIYTEIPEHRQRLTDMVATNKRIIETKLGINA